jgi:hypothetical protein
LRVVPSHLVVTWRLSCLAACCVAAQGSCEAQSGAKAGEPTARRGDPETDAKQATWTCTGNPCPWGASLSNYALAWPASIQPVATRLGYAVSLPVYAPAAAANGMTIAITAGKADVHAGKPADPNHRLLATLPAGQRYQVTGLAADEVLSVQSDAAFRYRLTLSDHRTPPPGPTAPPAAPPETPRPTPAPPSGPPGPVLHARRALWRCHHTPGCFSDPWTGAVIPWPAWSAHQSNGRTGNVLRFVHATDGAPLYPYMGAWADGCEVTVVSGAVAVVEWQRGASEWRETKLAAGESHIIHLAPAENGALIESQDGTFDFSVSLRSCTPQRIEPDPAEAADAPKPPAR